MSDETAITIYTGGSQALDVPIETPYQDVVMTIDEAIQKWVKNAGRSHSAKTRTAYRDTLEDFRAYLRAQCPPLDLDGLPSAVARAAEDWAGISKRDGGTIAPSTFNQRLAIVSSYYQYAIAFEVERIQSNPIARIKRLTVESKDAARYLPASFVKTKMATIDRSTPEGLRDYALLSVALATGRRASELAGLRFGHLHLQGTTCQIEWPHCKGNKRMQDTLSTKTTGALLAYLKHGDVYGNRLFTLPADAPIWISFSRRNVGQAIGTRTISNICEQYLESSKVHTTRHTWAVNMHRQGASYEQIRKGLGHSNLKITSDYMEEQLGYENPYASGLEDAFGI